MRSPCPGDIGADGGPASRTCGGLRGPGGWGATRQLCWEGQWGSSVPGHSPARANLGRIVTASQTQSSTAAVDTRPLSGQEERPRDQAKRWPTGHLGQHLQPHPL